MLFSSEQVLLGLNATHYGAGTFLASLFLNGTPILDDTHQTWLSLNSSSFFVFYSVQ